MFLIKRHCQIDYYGIAGRELIERMPERERKSDAGKRGIGTREK